MKINLMIIGFSLISLLGYSQNNTFTGNQAGASNTTGNGNTFTGAGAGTANTTGNVNTFTGAFAGFRNTTGNQNTFLGITTGQFNTTGSNNVFLGAGAGGRNTSGNENTYVGILAGQNANGSRNVFIGREAGQNEIGSNKLYIANSATSNPLIFGDFRTARLKINGNIEITGNITNTAFQNNITNVSNNTSAIGQNLNLINVNASGIANNLATIDTIGSGISNNAININTNASRISSNQATINVNRTAIDQLNRNVNIDSTNVLVGKDAGINLTSGERNTFYGTNAGANNDGNGNVFIGYEAGKNDKKSNKLYIANSSTSRPLIKGDFSSQKLVINGDLVVRGTIQTTRGLVPNTATAEMEEIEQLKQENEEIRSELQEIKNLLATMMGQDNLTKVINLNGDISLSNSPNPFGFSTTITFSLPANAQSAEIVIHDEQGQLVASYTDIMTKNEVTFNSNSQQSDFYICKLIVNGKEVARKKLLSSK